MKYSDNGGLWNRVRSRLAVVGMSLGDLSRAFGLDGEMLEYMAENGVVPEDRLLRRFSFLTGLGRRELLGDEPPATVEVKRSVPLVRGAEFVKDCVEIENLIGKFYIDRPADDCCTYLGIVVESDSMKRARIFRGDTVIVRRQMAAAEGDIVLASVRGKTMLRRFHMLNNVMWLEAEGLADDGPVEFSEIIGSPLREIRVYGKVVSVCRFFEENAPAAVF